MKFKYIVLSNMRPAFTALATLAITCGFLACGGPKKPVNVAPPPPERDLAKEAADALSDAVTDIYKGIKAGELNPQKVAADLQKVLSLDPKNVIALYNLGVLEELKENKDGAADFYKKAVEIDKSFKPAALNLARIYLMENKIDEAVALYQEFIKNEPREWQARLALAQMLFRSKRYNEAIDVSRQVLQRKGDEIEAFRILAESYYNIDNVALAALIAAKGLKLNEHDARLTFLIGKMQLKKGDIPGAVAKFRQAIEYAPNWIEARQERGAISLSFRDFNNAAEDFQTVVNMDKNNIPALLGLGISYKGLKRFEEAEKYYKQILDLEPKLPEAHWNLAILYHRDLNRFDDALKEYRTFKEVAPQNSDKLKDLDKTIKEVEDTIVVMKKMEERMKQQEEQKRQALAALNEIEAKINAKDFAAAEALLKPFIENAPGDMELNMKLRTFMAKALIGQERYQEAVTHVGFLLGMNPEDKEALAMYKTLEAKMGAQSDTPPEGEAGADGAAQAQPPAAESADGASDEDAALAAENAAESDEAAESGE